MISEIVSVGKAMESEHYLKRELYDLVQSDSEIFEFLQAGSLDGMWYWDIEDPVQEWLSPRFKEVFGYEDHEIPNTSTWWQENIFPEDLPAVMELAQRHLEDPSVSYDQVVRYRHRDGSTVWIRCRGIAIRNDQGKPIRMLGAHTDVTALKRTELELAAKNRVLEEVNRELVRANKDLEQFAYAASHDLREPLRMMSSFAELLEMRYGDALDEKGKRYLGFIVEGATRMQTLVDDMLAFARIGPDGLNRTQTDLGKLVRVVQSDLSEMLNDSGGTIEVAELPSLHVDSAKFERVIRNLVSNGLKFTRSEVAPVVQISASESDEGWTLSVRDNGIGIPEEHHEQVFQMFQRLNPRTEYEGNGIGLSLVSKIVELHGGRVTVESTPDVGSTFHVFIPHSDSSTHDGEPAVELRS